MRTTGFACVLLAAFLASPTVADEKPTPEQQVKDLVARFREIRTKKDYTRARMNILRSLGRHPLPGARKALLKTLGSSKWGDERVIAVYSLGKVADAETAKQLVALVAKKKKPELFHALGAALGGTGDEGVKAWLAGDALDLRDQAARAACVHAVADLQLADALPKLTALYAEFQERDSAVDLVHETVRAIGAIGGAGAREPLLRAALHPDWRVRLAAAEVVPLQDAEDAEFAARFMTLVTDDTPQVVEALARAAGEAKLKTGVPGLIGVLAGAPRLRTRHAAYVALKQISGQDFSHDASAWRTWWEHQNDPDKTPADIRKITFARYYNADVFSDRVVFIIDLSGSMSWPWRAEKKTKRIDVARKQILAVLEAMPAEHYFNLLVFANKVKSWRKTEMPGTPDNKAKAKKWILKQFAEPDGDTLTIDALRTAFANNPLFDTIYLLSDGNPSHGDFKSPEGIRADVAVRNRYRRATLNTIALTLLNLDRGMPNLSEKPREMTEFMKGLARDNGGTCSVIESAPK